MPTVERSPFLFDVRIDATCGHLGCDHPATRVVVAVADECDAPDCNEVFVFFYCDACAADAHVQLIPRRGVA